MISIRTPRWKEWLSVRDALARRAQGDVGCMCAPGPTGLPGMTGAPGEDGSQNGAPVVLSSRQIETLLTPLARDEKLRSAIQSLQARIAVLKVSSTTDAAQSKAPF